MKKLLLSFALCLSTTALFSQNQNVTNFNLYIINPNNCPYSITGYWTDAVSPPQQGSLFFTVGDTSGFTDVWYGQAASTSATSTMSLCVVPAPPCNCPSACVQQVPVYAVTILLCDSIVGIAEPQSSTLMDNKYYDLLGREIKDIQTYSINSFYIMNGRKYIKTQ